MMNDIWREARNLLSAAAVILILGGAVLGYLASMLGR